MKHIEEQIAELQESFHDNSHALRRKAADTMQSLLDVAKAAEDLLADIGVWNVNALSAALKKLHENP